MSNQSLLNFLDENSQSVDLQTKQPSDEIEQPSESTASQTIEDIIKRAERVMDLQASCGVKAVSLPAGFLVAYRMSGAALATKRESESEYVERIKNALPKETRGVFGRLRGAIERELDQFSVKAFGGLRYVSEDNIEKVMSILNNAQSGGIGKNSISIETVVDVIWENRDIINENAEQLGMLDRISTLSTLQNSIRIKTIMIDVAFGNQGISANQLSDIRTQLHSQIVTEVELDLKSRLDKMVNTLSKNIEKMKSKKSGTMHKKSSTNIMKQVKEIRSLNKTNNSEIEGLLHAIEGLTNQYSSKVSTKSKKSKQMGVENISCAQVSQQLAPKPKQDEVGKNQDPFSSAFDVISETL